MIRIENLRVELPGFALRDINLAIDKGDYFILVGPSASGKTVLLESIAGMHKVRAGRIWLNDRDITWREPEKRQIGMVYQDSALFPHLTVAQNIAFGLIVRGRKTEQWDPQMNRLVTLLEISHLLPRKPIHLSGGEKQKVALARALVTDPAVLLLDEPLGALDPQTRENVRQEIIKIHAELGVTIIHVTHDFEEAVTMGQHIAVIGAGTIRQTGRADEVFRYPNSEFVARFTMAINIFKGMAQIIGGTNTFAVGDTRLVTGSRQEGPCWAAIRPENILLSTVLPADHGINVFPAVVAGITNKGSIIEVKVDLPPVMTCLLTRHIFDEMDLEPGRSVYLTVPPASVHLFSG
ncbi:MAG: ABC transporter ATP-binding protein [Syntrophomonadaceae bacterium]